MEGKYKADLVSQRGLQWSVSCAGATTTLIGVSGTMNGSNPSWQDIDLTFTVPEMIAPPNMSRSRSMRDRLQSNLFLALFGTMILNIVRADELRPANKSRRHPLTVNELCADKSEARCSRQPLFLSRSVANQRAVVGSRLSHLVRRDFRVTAIASRLRYDDRAARLPSRDSLENVEIRRVWSFSLERGHVH